jgi:hypothetical protein
MNLRLERVKMKGIEKWPLLFLLGEALVSSDRQPHECLGNSTSAA